MRVRFWGTRGSIPVALTANDIRDKIVTALLKASGKHFSSAREAGDFVRNHLGFSVHGTYGGHTPCVELDLGGAPYFVCDFGSGARAFGAHVVAKEAGQPTTINAFMSHVHWDHLMGFPFFRPAYMPGMCVRIHGCHQELEHAFRLQQDPPCFPVPLAAMRANIEFVPLEPGRTVEIDGVAVTPSLQLHGGDSYGYRFEKNGKAVVYSTDSEHRVEDANQTERVVAFFKDADVVVFDAMYALADAISVKEDWGHSSNVVGVELAQAARVKKLILFHHEPANNDAALDKILAETRRFEELTAEEHRVMVSSAYDGMEIEI
jgi:phosphoribosyl 1,2-cyclic phosphodiesterase